MATEVLIVGAGPTELVRRLARRSVVVHVLDWRDGPGQASRAMVVHARTLELCQPLGLAEDAVARGARSSACAGTDGSWPASTCAASARG